MPIVRACFSTVELPEGAALRRSPKHPGRPRPDSFHAAFESRVLWYDAFRHADGRRALLIGPPPLNLAGPLRAARFAAQPSRRAVRSRLYESLSVAIWEFAVPEGTSALTMDLDGVQLEMPLRDNLAPAFAGRRLLTTLNRDNDLGWIAEWARHHVRHHGADAALIFDNGSIHYSPEDVAERLAGVAGMTAVCVADWPMKYGPFDPAVRLNPYWPRFLQIAALSVALRRFAPHAAGLMNCDIDELLAPGGGPVFEEAACSRWGLIRFRGKWVAPVPGPGAPATARTHRHFPFLNTARKLSPGKWCLDPSRAWIAENLGVHPYMHWIHGRPLLARFYGRRYFWHFEAINTGWKDARAAQTVAPAALVADPELAALWGAT